MAESIENRMVINDLLCYATVKFSRLPMKILKSAIADFYSPMDISTAKDKLFEEYDGLTDKSVKIPRRRKDSAARTSNELDDIFLMITHLDETKQLDKLSLYVSADPDKMPSVKLTDGDLALMIAKLGRIEDKVTAVNDTVNDLNRRTINSVSINRMPPTASIPLPDARSHLPPTQGTSALTSIRPQEAAGASRRVLLSTATEGAEDTSDGDTAGNSANPWHLSQSRRTKLLSRKRHCASNSPLNDGPGESINRVQARSSDIVMGNDGGKKRGKKVLFGASTTCALKASNNPKLPKSVFMVGNLDGGCSVDDMKEHLQSINVRVVTCFELPRSERQPDGNKAFRVCIIAEDKALMLDQEKWALGVSVRQWRFKDKSAPNEASSIASRGNAVDSTKTTNNCLNSASNAMDLSVHDSQHSGC